LDFGVRSALRVASHGSAITVTPNLNPFGPWCSLRLCGEILFVVLGSGFLGRCFAPKVE
jgi:hypothetical protein